MFTLLGTLFVWSTIVVHTFWDIWTLRNAQQAHFLQNQRAKSNFNPCLVVATTSKIYNNRKETFKTPSFFVLLYLSHALFYRSITDIVSTHTSTVTKI